MLSPETWPVCLRKWQRKQLFQNTFGEFSVWIWFLSDLILYMKKKTSLLSFSAGVWPLQGRWKECSFFTFTPRTPAVPADSSLGPPLPHLCLDSCTCAMELQSSSVLSAQKVQMRSRKLTEWNFERSPLNCLVIFFSLIVKGTKEFIHYPVAFQISPWKIIPFRLFGASVHGHFLRET